LATPHTRRDSFSSHSSCSPLSRNPSYSSPFIVPVFVIHTHCFRHSSSPRYIVCSYRVHPCHGTYLPWSRSSVLATESFALVIHVFTTESFVWVLPIFVVIHTRCACLRHLATTFVFVVRPRYPRPRHVVCAFIRYLPALTEIPLLQAPLSFSLEFGFLLLRTCHRPTPTGHRPSSHRLVSSKSSSFHRSHPLVHIRVHIIVMSIIKLDHCIPLLKSAQNFPKNLEPAASTAASKTKEKTAFKERWQEGNKIFHDNKKAGNEGQSPHSFFVCLKHSVIHDNDEPLSLTSSTSNPSITPPGHRGYRLIVPPSTPAAVVVVSLAIGATASVGIGFGVERITRDADDHFQLGARSRECYFMDYPPSQCGYYVTCSGYPHT